MAPRRPPTRAAAAHCSTLLPVLAALLFLAAAIPTALSSACRQTRDAAQSWCGLPLEVSNFQGHMKCDPSLLVGRPTSYQQLADLVRRFPKVKAAGVGHSWWPEQLCAGNTSDAIQVVTTEFDDVRRA